MTFHSFRDNTLMLMNELALAHRNANADTWPAARDAVLNRFNLSEELGHLLYEDPTS